jgi:hypothetical protein
MIVYKCISQNRSRFQNITITNTSNLFYHLIYYWGLAFKRECCVGSHKIEIKNYNTWIVLTSDISQ